MLHLRKQNVSQYMAVWKQNELGNIVIEITKKGLHTSITLLHKAAPPSKHVVSAMVNESRYLVLPKEKTTVLSSRLVLWGTKNSIYYINC